jgi:autotransporter-associated beta strand protein
VGASGGQAHLDNVQLNSLVLAETTPPTLTSFEDNKSGGPIIENEPVTYTVTFSEAMSASTVDSTDFENASTTTATTINSVTPTADPAVFLVVATPTHAGTLQLQVKAGATLKDLAGNALNTTSALPDDTIIIVNVTPPSTACHMLTFGANVAGSVAFIDSSTVSWYVPYGNVVTALAPTYTLSFGATCVPTSGTTRNFTSPQTYRVTAQDGSTFKDYVVTATVAAESALVWSAGGGDWDFTTPNWIGQTSLASQPFANGLNVIFDATGVGGTINIPSAVYPLSTTVTNDSPVSYEFSGGPIAMGSLTKSGSGTLKIDVMDPLNYVAVIPNTYSGGTIMNGGLLHLGAMQNGISPLCTGTVGTGPVTLNGGTIELDRVTETNALIVFGGTLYSQNGWGATWGGPITLNGTLTSQTAYGMTYSGAIGGTGGLLKTGPDKLTLSVSNSYTGPTTVTSGTLQCNNADALGSGALSISSTTGTKVNLNYTGEHNVAALTLGGVPQTGGTYGSTASPATIKNDAYFAGTGMVRVGGSTSFTTWANTNGATGQTPEQDHDNDGVENGIEHFMGLTGSSFTAMPGLDATNKVSWTMDTTYQGTYEVQTSPDLATWTNVDPRPTPSGGTLSYTLPADEPGGKSFVRLLVTPAP